MIRAPRVPRLTAPRRLALGDMDAVARVYRMSYDDRLPALAGRHTPDEDRWFFRNIVFRDCEVWGVGSPGLTGFIAFRAGWIDQLYVLPGAQGRGAGRALVAAAKAGQAELHLWTFLQNAPAMRFYERQGFRRVRETDGRENEEGAPAILYRWAA